MTLITKTVDLSMTKIQLDTDATIRGILIRANEDNVDIVYIGTEGIQVYRISPNESIRISGKLSDIFGLANHDGRAGGIKDKVTFLAWTDTV